MRIFASAQIDRGTNEYPLKYLAAVESGESEELNGILPGIRKRGAKVILIAAEVGSKLALRTLFCIPRLSGRLARLI